MKAHACVVLAIDPGATSGAAIFGGGEESRAWAVEHHARNGLAGSYATRDASERHAIVAMAVNLASICAEPLVVVAETWTAHGAFGGARTQRGLGAAWGRWAEQIEAAGIPKRRIIRVYPATWQGAILSAGGRGWTRERREAASIAYVERRFGIECGADEAAAICIGVWGMHASKVGAVLPRKRKVA